MVNVIKVVPYGNTPAPLNTEKTLQPTQANQKPTQANQKPAPANQSGSGFEVAKKKCIELGFKVGTESFGQCILKLSN